MWIGRVVLLLLAVGRAVGGAEGGPEPPQDEVAPKLGKVKVPVAKTPKTVLEVRSKFIQQYFLPPIFSLL
jgi:hypothetical protein